MERIKVIPASPELVVLDPEHGFKPLPADGALVELSQYWLMHLRDGSVIQIGGRPIDAPVTE
jgi:hypothetical protein